jgi:peptidoglycan-associated lipoprotein
VNYRRAFMCAAAGIVMIQAPRVAQAQHAGIVELGGFFQVDRLDEAIRTKRTGMGAGGRVGLFISPRWELEAEASYSQADPVPTRPTKAQINYYIGRLNYNIPFGSMPGDAVILSAGAGADRLDAHSDFILSPELGLRKQFSRSFGMRLDAAGMIAPNASRSTFKYPAPVLGVNHGAKYLSNYQGRIGFQLLIGNSAPDAPPVVVAAPAPAPEPQRVDSSAIFAERARARQRQDSIDAANRRAAAEREAAARALADARALLNAPVYFDYDKSEIRPDAKSALDSKLPLLRANASMKIRIEGNADSRGTNEYNMALGLRRANAARRYLVSQGIEESRIEVVSYGEERPVDQGTTEDAYQKNRRDDFVITVGGDNITVPK